MNTTFVASYRSKVRRSLLLMFLPLFTFHFSLHSQQSQVYKPNINRILFVLDVSGSMKEKLGGKEKYEIAKELLYQLIDSVEKKNPNVEFAVRAFGYQSHRTVKNCKDSKLLVPFAKNNAANIKSALSKITPQGMTPIAYSLSEAVNDFPTDVKSLNSIIIITDGDENCEGDPCTNSQLLLEKRISLRPFIVGVNAGDEFLNKLKCVGTVLDTKDEASMYSTVGVIIKQTLNTTSAQINLLDANENPTITNIPFTLYDHSSGRITYNFIHSLNEKGNPDTLYLDPVGIYDLELHTYPPIQKESIELVPGKHNIIAIDVPAGDFSVSCFGASVANNDAQVILRQKKTTRNILNVQDLNEEEKYLADDYKFEILTNPAVYIDSGIVAFGSNKFSVPGFGTLSIMATESLLISIYTKPSPDLQMVERFEMTSRTESRKIQPGEYLIVYKAKNNYKSESTKTQYFKMEEGRVVVLNLQ